MSDDRGRLDPRFDPAFQRGYDPSEAATDAPAPSSPVSRPVADSATDAAADARPVTGAPSQPEPRLTPRLDPGAGQVPAGRTSTPRPVLTPDSFVPDEPRRVNRWVIALAVVSVVLTLGGIVLITRLRELFADTQNSAEFDYITLQSLVIGSPLLVALGLATGIGLLFLLAVRRDR